MGSCPATFSDVGVPGKPFTSDQRPEEHQFRLTFHPLIQLLLVIHLRFPSGVHHRYPTVIALYRSPYVADQNSMDSVAYPSAKQKKGWANLAVPGTQCCETFLMNVSKPKEIKHGKDVVEQVKHRFVSLDVHRRLIIQSEQQKQWQLNSV